MADDNNEDKTSLNNEEDDLENDFGGGFDKEDEDNSFEDDDKGEDGNKDDGKKKTDDKKDEDDDDKKKGSAIVQKKKYREKLNKALKDLETLKEKYEGKAKGDLTDEEKKEKAANEFLTTKIKDILKEIEGEKSRSESEAEEKLQEEIDDILEENTDITEKQILDACEEFGVSPSTALKIIRDREKYKGKEKPKMPQNKRGTPEVKEDDKDKDKKPKTLDEINRSIKAGLKKGDYK